MSSRSSELLQLDDGPGHYQHILAAKKRIDPYVNQTPVMTSSTVDAMVGHGARLFFKCENYQKIGAFKMRGATNAIMQLTADERAKGVATHSSGNHAQAVALASRLLGVHATIIIPEGAPAAKVAATKGYGADVIRCQASIESRHQTTADFVRESGSVLIHPFANIDVIHGAGTAALELLEEHDGEGEGDAFDVLLCPIGGGGFLNGTALAAKGRRAGIRVIACEPELVDDAARAFVSGQVEPNARLDTIADGVRTTMEPLTVNLMRHHVDEVVTVSEQAILDAMKLMWERMKMVVEPSGAVPLAAAFKLAEQGKLDNAKVGLMVSGGNLDLTPMWASYQSAIDAAAQKQ